MYTLASRRMRSFRFRTHSAALSLGLGCSTSPRHSTWREGGAGPSGMGEGEMGPMVLWAGLGDGRGQDKKGQTPAGEQSSFR